MEAVAAAKICLPMAAPFMRKDVLYHRRSQTCSVYPCNYKPRAQLTLRSGTSSNRGRLYASRASAVTPIRHVKASSVEFIGRSKSAPYSIRRSGREPGSRFLVEAYKDDMFKFSYPVISEKPDWWWRTLACVPYLVALQISDVGYYFQPFLEHYRIFENLIYFIPGAISRWPSWFSMIYCQFSYIGIIKNKDWPHFFRHHLMMGMLLETALQIVWYTSNFMPLIHFTGTFGIEYWAGVGFAYIFILLQCVRCALAGSYAHIPFISTAAYIHSLFNIGGFHRPF